jgi:sugar lactone lactonase YvrE
MLVLRDPGQVYLLRHSFGARAERDPIEAWVERIDPVTLEPLTRSPDLPAGPFWPGGLAAHANGSLYLVCGNHCHRLDRDCAPIGSFELPQPRPYNSFVILPDGALVMKDLDRTGRHASLLTVLDPDTLEPLCDHVAVPESSIARLSADGHLLYVVGDSTIFRYRWDPDRGALERDRGWEFRYRTLAGQSYGWDVALEGGHAWFMDQGEHDYLLTMLGAGVAGGPVHLIRVALDEPSDTSLVEVCGAPRGAVTNPPLFDPERRVAVAYDSANGVLAAWRLEDGRLEPLWRKRLATAGHLVRFADTGELIAYDFEAPRLLRRRAARVLGRRGGRLVLSSRARRLAASRVGEQVVVLDIETGEERARGRVPSPFQSVLFPCPGWERDVYYCSFSTIARISVK